MNKPNVRLKLKHGVEPSATTPREGVISLVRGGSRGTYLWVGTDPDDRKDGRCYGFVTGPEKLRKLATEILAELGPKRKRK